MRAGIGAALVALSLGTACDGSLARDVQADLRDAALPAPPDGAAPDASAPASDASTPASDASAPDASAPASDASAPAPDASAPASDASPTAVCPSPLWVDPFPTERAACSFSGGATPAATLGFTAAERRALPIKHIIVVMKENRSFDHIFGNLAARGQPGTEPIPAGYQTSQGRPTPATTTCLKEDPDHQWEAMHHYVNGGKMDAFDENPGQIAYYDQSDLPFDYWLASTFALADRFFPSVLSGTGPNRFFLESATAGGVFNNGAGVPPPGTPKIYDRLRAKGVTVDQYYFGVEGLEAKLAAGTLSDVTFVDSEGAIHDEHPPADLQVGEAWTRRVYQAVRDSPYWMTTAMIWTYDEGGGFFDHVPPPRSCPPADGTPDADKFFELGIRVPMVLVSPWARPHHVSHVLHETTSITRFIEAVHDLPALTARDANSDALLDMFDFACPQVDVPAPPDAGTGGCR
jgi:phospholipase C